MAIDWLKSGRMTLALACVLIAMPAIAQNESETPPQDEEVVEKLRYYSVEFIVFEYASNVSAGNEIFDPVEPEMPNLLETNSQDNVLVYGDIPTNTATAPTSDDLVAFADIEDAMAEEVAVLAPIPSKADINFRLLTIEELTMGDIHERLQALDAYQPVLWSGWVQSTHDRDRTPAILLRTLGRPPLHIDGTLTLYLKNYLHLAVDLTREQYIATYQPVVQMEKPARGDGQYSYRDDRPEQPLSNQQTVIYQIQEDRLFNSGQLRYYDHPKFGVLARVNRVEVTDPDDVGEDATADARSMLSSTQ